MRAHGISSPDYQQQNLLAQRKQDLQAARNNPNFDVGSIYQKSALQPQASTVVQNLNPETGQSGVQNGSNPGLNSRESKSNIEVTAGSHGPLLPLDQNSHPIFQGIKARSVKDALAAY